MSGRFGRDLLLPPRGGLPCDCRKPKPGMFLEIAQRFNVDLKGMPVVGEQPAPTCGRGCRWGCKPYLVKSGKGSKTALDPALPKASEIFPIAAAVVTFRPYECPRGLITTSSSCWP